MAKKELTKAPAAAAAASTTTPAVAAPVAPAKPKTIDMFKFVKAVAEGDKLAPQAKVIVNTIQLSAGKDGISRDALNKALEGKLVTRQPIGRIVTYYQKLLVESGYIVIDSIEVAV